MARRLRRSLGVFAFRLGTRAALVRNVVGIFHEPFIEIVANFLTYGTDEVDALNRLIDPLAVEDSSLEFLNADTQEFLVAFLDFLASRFVFWELLFARFLRLLFVERVEVLFFSLFLSCPRHEQRLPGLARAAKVLRILVTHPEKSLHLAEPGVLHHLTIGSTQWTCTFRPQCRFLRSFCFLSHRSPPDV